MNSDLYQKVLNEGACVDLSTRAKWRLSGADRVRYLNGQVTNDVRRVSETEALYACVTNLKGKIEGDVFIHASAGGESLLLDAEPALRDHLGARLEKYIIADDAELADVTEEFCLWHVFGSPDLEPGVRAARFGVSGMDYWLPADAAFTPPLPVLTAAEAEDFRILLGIPRYPNELNSDVFPPEAGLEARGMSFTKGCYIGQEILSRIKTTGKMPRVMVGWEAQAPDTAVAAGEGLFMVDESGAAKAVGVITSVARHPSRGVLTGLALVRQGAAAPDSVLLVGSDVPRIAASIKTLSLVHP